ncbi:uncharacterized protein LOC112638195 isoform X3 [Camponotus floridanus]|uniref:uncharacterized protein LOC112638195 isoform X3 n=1 Tax=Camponotus floridanus TaxID=104421 RepID=UPI000DC6D09F|nr:uncharacterized protein LOC112638195 isoform X3 [Camponotus floridanus]
MLAFVKKIMEDRIEQIHKSAETTKKKETCTSKNTDAFIVSEKYQEIQNILGEINLLYEKSKIPKKVKKMMNQLEVKMNNLFENFVIASEIKCDDILVLTMAHINLGRIYLFKEDPDVAKSQEKIDSYSIVDIFINQLWAMYGIMLLRSSKERLLQHESNNSCEANNIESKSHSKSEKEIMKPLTFVELEKRLKNIIRYHITDTYVSNLDDVKIIFQNVLKWLNEIYMYFNKRNQFIPQVQVVLCTSKAYKYYAYFEGSKSKQINVIKQQIEILEGVTSTIASKYTTVPEYHYFKKLNFELAVTYSTLLDLMSEELDEIEEITDETRIEMKQLVTNVIHKFNLFTNLS